MKPTQEQVVAWGRKAGLQCAKNYDYRGSYEAMPLLEQQDFDKVLLALTLAYEAGRKDENEACDAIAAWILKMPENDVSAAIRARREQ